LQRNFRPLPILLLEMQALWSGATGRENLSQRELVALAKQRDSATWSSIFSEHYDVVYRYIFGRLGRKEESEDLASQVFLEALQGIDSFTDMGRPLGAWLFGIARNLANSSARRTSRLGQTESLDADGASDHIPQLPGGLSAESIDLITGLDGLTKEQREVLVLRFWVGLSAKEVGRVLSKKEPAIYALQVRAIASLRRIIGYDSRERKEAAA
jgi:RNA polymerase sigma-70 factor, ECF subfamily